MSDGLLALKRIRQETCPCTYCQDFDKNKCCDTIEKELKALEIIKNKNVHLVLLRVCYGIPNNKYAVKVYNEKVPNKLTQKEYDLLKELKV